MKSVLVGALAFFAVPTALSLLLTLASLSNRPRNEGSTTLDAFVLPAYLLLLAMTLATVGFVLVTAAAPVWRRLTPTRAVLIALPLGLTYPIVYLLGLVANSVLSPRLHSSPWLAAVLVHLMPGAVLGVTAILVAALVQRHSAKPP